MPTSRISASAILRDPLGNVGGVGHAAFGIEPQPAIPAERGEFVTIEVHSDGGDARAAEIVLRLLRCLQEISEGGGQDVRVVKALVYGEPAKPDVIAAARARLTLAEQRLAQIDAEAASLREIIHAARNPVDVAR